jgi:cytochrome subunit of sulfide dehydrogenase
MQTSTPALILVKSGEANLSVFANFRVQLCSFDAQTSPLMTTRCCPNLEEDMKKSLAIGLLLAGALGAASAQAVDTKARFMAANCAYCHGPEGKSRGAIPSLAGLEKGYFVDQMKAFRDGTRPGTVMQKHAMGYTDAEFEQLGVWFAAIK